MLGEVVVKGRHGVREQPSLRWPQCFHNSWNDIHAHVNIYIYVCEYIYMCVYI